MKLIVANWKANPLKTDEAIALAKATDNEGVVIAPPFIFIDNVGKSLAKAKLAAQDDFWGNLGAYTGEVSWRQLVEMGVEYVILGHSERRKYLKETDELINNKVIASLEVGLKVVLCVGEPAEIRNKGIDSAKLFVEQQLDKDLIGFENLKNKDGNLFIAYEPIWAIGTGEPDSPEGASEVAVAIKKFINFKFGIKNIPVLYGGSVKPDNAGTFLSRPEIDGALVGGASLDSAAFNAIVEAAN